MLYTIICKYEKFMEDKQWGLPDRAKIFLAAMYIWTWLLFHFTRLCNFLLKLIIIYFPNNICYPNFKYFNNYPIHILQSRDYCSNLITDKLKLYMNKNWDKIENNVDLQLFSEQINSSIIWIAYLLECDKKEYFQELDNLIKNDKLNIDKLKKLVKILIVDFNEKMIHKFKYDEINDDKPDEYIETQDPLLFGDVEFD